MARGRNQSDRCRSSYPKGEGNTKVPNEPASKLAVGADSFKKSSSARTGRGKTPKETCGICMERTDVLRMHSVYNCLHRCCISCVRKHVQVKLREGTLPTCPHEGCNSRIKISKCEKLLTPELYKVLNQRLKESNMPILERIYCPYPKCSALMSKRNVFKSSKRSSGGNAEQSGHVTCVKCRGEFCVNCKVPWHGDMTCSNYKKLHPYSCAEEEMLNSLAKVNRWRQCVKCSHMIELAAGCYHIICRCGYQFCYTCGLEWKKEKACRCPLWNERLIIY